MTKVLPFILTAVLLAAGTSFASADVDGGLHAPLHSRACTQDHSDPECCGTPADIDPDHDGDVHTLCAPVKKTPPIVNRNNNTNNSANLNVNNLSNHQNQSQTSTNVNTNLANAHSSSTATATGGSSTANATSAGGAGGSVTLAPGAVTGGAAGAGGQGGSIAAGAVQSSNYVSVSTPQVIQNAPLSSCDSSGALSVGVGVSGASGAFLQQGTVFTGSVSYSTPIGRRARHCGYVAPVPIAPVQPINVYITNPTAPAPVIQMVAPVAAPFAPHLTHISNFAPRCDRSGLKADLDALHAMRAKVVTAYGTKHPYAPGSALKERIHRECGTEAQIDMALDA